MAQRPFTRKVSNMEQRIAIVETVLSSIKDEQASLKDDVKKLSQKVSMFLYIGIGIAISSGIVNEKMATLLKTIFGA